MPDQKKQRTVSDAAKRALNEAKARREDTDRKIRDMPPERAGPKGLEPARYGDWEKKGIASDF